MKKCEDVMTKKVVACLPKDTAEKAAQLMKQENVGAMPVVENEKSRKLVGILTDRDLVLKVLAEGRDARSMPVEAMMTRQVVTCHPEDDLQVALDAMSGHQLRRIPVVDDQDMLLGIIAQADVATRLDKPKKTGLMVKQISQQG